MKFKYRITVLNISVAIYLCGIILSTVSNYSDLSSGEGWGVVAMVGLAVIGILAGLADLIIQFIIRNRLWQNIAEIIIIVGLAIAFLLV